MKYFVYSIFSLLCICYSCSQEYKSSHDESHIAEDMMAASTPQEQNLSYQTTTSESATALSDRAKAKGELADNEQKVQGVPTPPPYLMDFAQSNAASTINDDLLHKFIRKAELRFKVHNVPQATYTIENIVLKNNGFIINSSIQNNQNQAVTTNISEDSAVVVYYSNLYTTMELRVPKERLDTTLKELIPLATHIDYRIVDAQDVTIDILSDQLTQARLAKKNDRVKRAVDTKGSQLDDVMRAEQELDNIQLQKDNKTLFTYSLNDRIAYSNIYIQLYQNPVKYEERIVREKVVDEYQPSFGDQLINALDNGWMAIRFIFILLVNIWPLIVVAIIGTSIYLYNKKKKNTK